MPKCSNCRNEIDRVYWMRLFPFSTLCHECWGLPENDLAELVRDTIAFRLYETRKTSRDKAKELHSSFRGTGIPAKVRKRVY